MFLACLCVIMRHFFTSKIVDFHHPEALKKILDLELKEDGDSDEKLLELCRTTIAYSVKNR